MWSLFDCPKRGLTYLALAVIASAVYFFGNPGPRNTWYLAPFREGRPSFFEQFQSGNPNDFAVVFTFGLILWIGYAVAVLISDYRATGRLW